MLESFAESIVGGLLNEWILSIYWLWPFMETVHFFGLSLLLGGLIVIDLRMAGHFKALNPAASPSMSCNTKSMSSSQVFASKWRTV